jgi:hypothetical protein
MTVFAVCCAAHVCQAAEIHLLPNGETRGEWVRLADIADVESDEESEANTLRETRLCPAPQAGSSRTLSVVEIRELLARQEVNVAEHRIYGASRTVVSASGETPPAESEEPRPLTAPRGAKQIRQASRRPAAQQRQVAQASAESEEPAEILVMRNDAVSLVVRAAGVKISTSAIALADGAEGELIEVRSATDRRKLFLARVVGHQRVEIQTGAPRKPITKRAGS